MKVIGNNYRGLKSIYKLMGKPKTTVVIPTWNGKDGLKTCLDSLLTQTEPAQVIVVDNGSTDGSAEFIDNNYPEVILIRHSKNLGFTGGVNAGIRKAMQLRTEYVALLNNDAEADKDWLKNLVSFLDSHDEVGIVTSKICDSKRTHLDSTGDLYTTWGLPFPRGRGEHYSDKYDNDTWVFGASGGASLYRIRMLEDIGLFDDDFFAYYEDVDLSFRAQLAGWRIAYVPEALVYHEIGATSSKIKGFTTYHTIKNLPFLLYKNVPRSLMRAIWPRYALALSLIWLNAMARGHFWSANKGVVVGLALLPKKLQQRKQIQESRKVSDDYIRSILSWDLPPNARRLRKMRAKWQKLRGKR